MYMDGLTIFGYMYLICKWMLSMPVRKSQKYRPQTCNDALNKRRDREWERRKVIKLIGSQLLMQQMKKNAYRLKATTSKSQQELTYPTN